MHDSFFKRLASDKVQPIPRLVSSEWVNGETEGIEERGEGTEEGREENGNGQRDNGEDAGMRMIRLLDPREVLRDVEQVHLGR